ncbi:uncharacterized protein LOC132559722 [Ylistrum balloti]|uniref:uncharacterized protein LOC132559722 n=1 Tax=Ylistrum balloti TaxID=509963 RepID=UPI002905E2C8|nr:uncharacterized protein LOC132559722 [Ylistrum balloti]
MELALLAMFILGAMQQSMACTYTPARQEITVFGTKKYYCDYEVGRGNSTVKLSVIPGSRFRTSECSECHCTRNGLQCCGYGIRSANLVVPTECKVLPDGCEPRLVLKSDNKSECKSMKTPVRSRPGHGQNVNSRVQTGRIRPQATQTMPTAARQDEGKQVPENHGPPRQAPRQKANVQVQGHQGQLRQSQGKLVSRNQIPGKQGPRLQAPAKQAAGNQAVIQKKTLPNKSVLMSLRPAQLASTPAPVKPTIQAQHRRPAPRPSANRSWRYNPFRHRAAMNEENMQLMQQMMLFQALSGGQVNPLQSLMLMNMLEM